MSLDRPARLQVNPDTITDDDKPPQTGHTFNVWFLNWAGGDLSARNSVQLKFRVNIQQDTGYTRGVDGKSPLCIFFAKGSCYKGEKCPLLHRLPRLGDARIPTQDCFGRDKTADYRDDMGGVGLLAKVNRSLFVGGINIKDNTHDVVSQQFSEFGQIDKVRVLPSKKCAFVSFRTEAEAQFAKEAMDAQSLDGKDVISVKWANDDPNPNALLLATQDMEELAMATVKRLLESQDSDETAQKRTKTHSGPDDEHTGPVTPAESDPETRGAQGSKSFFGEHRLKTLKALKLKVQPPPHQKSSLQLVSQYGSDSEPE